MKTHILEKLTRVVKCRIFNLFHLFNSKVLTGVLNGTGLEETHDMMEGFMNSYGVKFLDSTVDAHYLSLLFTFRGVLAPQSAILNHKSDFLNFNVDSLDLGSETKRVLFGQNGQPEAEKFRIRKLQKRLSLAERNFIDQGAELISISLQDFLSLQNAYLRSELLKFYSEMSLEEENIPLTKVSKLDISVFDSKTVERKVYLEKAIFDTKGLKE